MHVCVDRHQINTMVGAARAGARPSLLKCSRHAPAAPLLPRRLASRVRVLLTYDLYGGLSNQLYGHVDALALGLLAGAEVVLPRCAHAFR